MARTRNSARAAKVRRARPVTVRTQRRRQRQAEAEASVNAITQAGRKRRDPETPGQARVWQRKYNRYRLAGLCDLCAVAAAWGHSEGFQALEAAGRVPCVDCQPLVDMFDRPGPRGSKWRKLFTKLEYMDEEALGAWIDEHTPED